MNRTRLRGKGSLRRMWNCSRGLKRGAAALNRSLNLGWLVQKGLRALRCGLDTPVLDLERVLAARGTRLPFCSNRLRDHSGALLLRSA